MGKIEDLIASTEREISEAKTAEDETRQQAAQARLDELNEAKREVDSAKGSGRTEGRDSGIQKEREKQAKALGVSVENLDTELERIAEDKRKQQSEAERLQAEMDSHKQTADSEKQAREKAEARLRERDIQDSIANALDEAGYKGKRAHALGAIDRSKVEEKEQNGVTTFDAKPAVEALKKDEFPGFSAEPPQDPPTPPAGGVGTGTSGDESPARQWAKRQMRRAG